MTHLFGPLAYSRFRLEKFLRALRGRLPNVAKAQAGFIHFLHL